MSVSAPLAAIRAQHPLLHCISNIVSANDCANLALAIGASPIMAQAPQEMADIAALASAVVLNTGTPDEAKFTAARTAATSAVTPDEKMAADNVLTGALRQLLMVAEAYPDLKANTNFIQLQATLQETEDKISYARQSYNDCVLNYNNGIQTFPGNIFAGIFQFKPRTGFEAAEAAREAPQVKF